MSSEEDADNDYERTLCQLPQVHVFKIPVRKSADGHRAADWPKEPAWSGKLKIVAKGKLAVIFLVDDKNQIFAACHVNDEAAVERVLDSGRYFVLRITNAQGRHAFIGIAFNERNDAFDFNVALAEFKSECEREVQASKLSDVSLGPLKDLSIKEGEKIKIKINTKKKVDSESSSSSSSSSSSTTTDANLHSSKPLKAGLLPPPPSKAAPHTVTATPSGVRAFASGDPFSAASFDSANSFSEDPFSEIPATKKPSNSAVDSTNLLDL